VGRSPTSKASRELLKLPGLAGPAGLHRVIGWNSIRGKSSTALRGSSAAWALIASTTRSRHHDHRPRPKTAFAQTSLRAGVVRTRRHDQKAPA